jgi:hypothetical protein
MLAQVGRAEGHHLQTAPHIQAEQETLRLFLHPKAVTVEIVTDQVRLQLVAAVAQMR